MKLNDTTRWKIIWLDPFNRSLGRPTAAHRWRLSGRWNEYCMLAPFLSCRFSCCSADFSFQCYYVDGSLWIDLSILCYISGFYFLIELHGVWEDNDRPRNEDLCYLSVDICFADYWCWCKRTISFGVTTQPRWRHETWLQSVRLERQSLHQDGFHKWIVGFTFAIKRKSMSQRNATLNGFVGNGSNSKSKPFRQNDILLGAVVMENYR